MDRASHVSLFPLALAFVSLLFIASSGQTTPSQDGQRLDRITDCGKQIIRVPLAATYNDEHGEIVYKINGNESWRRTDIEVKRGQKVEILAGGIVRWAPDGIEKIDVTADGTRPPYRDGWNYYHFPYPETGIGSLVMRIGKGIYPAGSNVVIDVEDDGFVEFMVNDDRLDDNSGFFIVKVTVRPRAN